MILAAFLTFSCTMCDTSNKDDEVDSLISVVCDKALTPRKRYDAMGTLLQGDVVLAEDHNVRLIALLPGKASNLTIRLVHLLGEKGNASALDALVRHFDQQRHGQMRIGRMVRAYASAIERLETRLKIKRKLHPALRKMVEDIRARRGGKK